MPHSWQLQYLEIHFEKEQRSRKSDPKTFLLEESTRSESDKNVPSPKKDKDWRSSKPISIASSSNTAAILTEYFLQTNPHRVQNKSVWTAWDAY